MFSGTFYLKRSSLIRLAEWEEQPIYQGIWEALRPEDVEMVAGLTRAEELQN